MCDVEKLLFLIENRAPIYNKKLKEHSDKRIIDNLWIEIAEEMNTTVTECKTKYTTLRNSYARFLREKPTTGYSAKKKIWYLSAAMSFLKDHMMVHRSSIDPDTMEDCMSPISSGMLEYKDAIEQIEYISPPSATKKRKSVRAEEKPEPPAEFLKVKLCRNESEQEDPNLTFFKSVLPDLNKLCGRRQRKAKQDFLFNVNKLLEEQEMESLTIKYE